MQLYSLARCKSLILPPHHGPLPPRSPSCVSFGVFVSFRSEKGYWLDTKSSLYRDALSARVMVYGVYFRDWSLCLELGCLGVMTANGEFEDISGCVIIASLPFRVLIDAFFESF
jgi:hypothetical protein